MTNNPQQPSTAILTDLRTNAFMDERDLRRFCDHSGMFKPVLERVNAGAGFQSHVDALISYCETFLLVPELLEGVEQYNPRQYARFAPKLLQDGPSEPSSDAQVSTEYNGIDSDQYDIARDLILEYLDRKRHKRVSFERIRKWIDPEYDDDFLMEVIRRNHTQLRRELAKGRKPAVTRR